MQRAAWLLAALLIAGPAFAEKIAPEAPDLHWRDCSTDDECILVQGTCELTAVNVAAKDEAASYYQKLHTEANCVKKFWTPDPKRLVAECKPLAGSKASEDAEVVPHSNCAAVAKPADKK